MAYHYNDLIYATSDKPITIDKRYHEKHYWMPFDQIWTSVGILLEADTYTYFHYPTATHATSMFTVETRFEVGTGSKAWGESDSAQYRITKFSPSSTSPSGPPNEETWGYFDQATLVNRQVRPEFMKQLNNTGLLSGNYVQPMNNFTFQDTIKVERGDWFSIAFYQDNIIYSNKTVLRRSCYIVEITEGWKDVDYSVGTSG